MLARTTQMCIILHTLASNMLPAVVVCLAVLSRAVSCIIWPIMRSFYDTKGLWAYLSYFFLPGVTDITYWYPIACDFRSSDLIKAHENPPMLRIGPSKLSLGVIEVIRETLPPFHAGSLCEGSQICDHIRPAF